MISKIFIILMLLVSVLMAKSYHFKESRYSDALGKHIELSGEIEFLENGLGIKYDENSRVLKYEDGELELFDDGESVELQEEESEKIAQYFELILMLNAADKETLDAAFSIKKEEFKEILTPKDSLKNYISKIELRRDKTQLREIKLFLSNDDKITISIEDEIR